MRLFKINLVPYWGSDEPTDKKKQKRAVVLRMLGIKFDEDRPEWVRDLIVNDQQFLDLAAAGQEPEVVEEIAVPKAAQGSPDEMMARFLEVADKFIQMADRPAPVDEFNARCNVHVPGHTLSTYNRLMLCEDACTDALQDHLTQGWRIIAVCPQPDQRRPDYVLGRWEPEFNNDSSAVRGGVQAGAKRGYNG